MAEHFRASGTVLLLTWRRLCSVFSISAGRTETTTEVPPLLLGVGGALSARLFHTKFSADRLAPLLRTPYLVIRILVTVARGWLRQTTSVLGVSPLQQVLCSAGWGISFWFICLLHPCGIFLNRNLFLKMKVIFELIPNYTPATQPLFLLYSCSNLYFM